VTSDKLGLIGKTNGMDHEIEHAPSPAEPGENGVDGANVLDVAREHEIGFDGGSQRLHALAERLALLGKCELGAVFGQRLGYTPGDRVVVGDPHDQAALTLHQPWHASGTHVLEHDRSVGAAKAEGIGQNTAELYVVLPGANDRHVGKSRIEPFDICALADEA